VKEQSHKREMSDAVRGDFERLRGRGVATTFAVPESQDAPPEGAEVADAGTAEPSQALPPAPAEDAPRPFLRRLLGR
jgi:hypothetical protein